MALSLLASASAFQRLLTSLGEVAARQVVALLEQATAQGMEEMYPALMDQTMGAAGVMTAEWYHSLAPDAQFETRPAAPAVLDQLVGDVRWALSRPNPRMELAGAARRRVFTTSRQTVYSNARREGVRYARLAKPTACPWCRIIATNEAHFRSEASATKGHHFCECVGVAVRAGEVWTPPDYVADWERQYNDAVAKVGGTQDIDALAKEMRPAQYAMVKDDLNTRRREVYAQKKAAKPTEPKLNKSKQLLVRDKITKAGSVTELADVLSKEYGLNTQGMLPGDGVLDLDVAREYANAMNDMLTKYPKPKIGHVRINTAKSVRGFAANELDSTYAWVRPGFGMSEEIVLNASDKKFQTRASLLKLNAKDERTGFHPKGKPGEPAYSTIIHEFGHVLDNAGNLNARNLAGQVLRNTFHSSPEGARFSGPQIGSEAYEKAYNKFLRKNMSGYSFIRNSDSVNPAEALAEAFQDVEINGDKATVTSKALHQVLTEWYRTMA